VQDTMTERGHRGIEQPRILLVVDEVKELAEREREREYFAGFELTQSEGERMLGELADFNVAVEPRGGYIVRRHVSTLPVKDKPYFYSVDALTWKRLGVFVAVSFFDQTRKRTRGFGELVVTVYRTAADAVGNLRPDKPVLSETVAVTPGMWEIKSDLEWWDTRINHGAYERSASDQVKRQWSQNWYFNFDGVLYVLVNRDVGLLEPPGVYYVEAQFKNRDKQKKTGRYVRYAEPR